MKRLKLDSAELGLVLVAWLCSLPLIALVLIPFFGRLVAGLVALALLLVALLACWATYGARILQNLLSHSLVRKTLRTHRARQRSDGHRTGG